MYKKAWCTCKIVVLLIKPIVFVAFPLPSPSSDLKVPSTELLKQQLRRRLQKRQLNWGKVALLQTWSRLFHLVQFVKFWQFFLELNLKRLNRSSGKGKGKENRCLAAFLFLSRLKLGMSCSDGKDRNVQKKKKVMHVQSCCFANLNLLLFRRSRYRLRHPGGPGSAIDISLISSLMTVYKWWEEPGNEPVITCYGNFVTASIFLLCV